MILNLDHHQRLHVISALDLLENIGRREGFAVCRLQEKLDLTDQEREVVGLRKLKAENGRVYTLWNNNGQAALEYDLSEDDVQRITNAIDKYPMVLARDRQWWLSLTAQLPALAESNGDKL